MKQIFIILAIGLLLFLPFASAIQRESFRTEGGSISYINGYNSFIPEKTNIKFSGWYVPQLTDKKWENGQAGLSITTETTTHKRIVINGQYKNAYLVSDTPTEKRIFLEGTATFWEKGNLPKRIYSNIVYIVDKTTNKITVVGAGDVNFVITDLSIK